MRVLSSRPSTATARLALVAALVLWHAAPVGGASLCQGVVGGPPDGDPTVCCVRGCGVCVSLEQEDMDGVSLRCVVTTVRTSVSDAL